MYSKFNTFYLIKVIHSLNIRLYRLVNKKAVKLLSLKNIL